MRINNTNYHLNFSSGLNSKIIHQCENLNIKQIEENFRLKNIQSDFKNCRPIAYGAEKVLGAFEILKIKTGANLFRPNIPAIRTYKKEDLNFDFTGKNFCIPESREVFKTLPAFRTGSVFFENEDSLEILNDKLDASFANNERSSSHYLAPFVHEYMHNIYLNYIYSKFGYEGDCPYTKAKYMIKGKENKGLEVLSKLQNLTFSDAENKIIEENIGSYATGKQNQYHEVFAETFTKLFCDCLTEDGKPNKNPLDLIKLLPANFLMILNKLFI